MTIRQQLILLTSFILLIAGAASLPGHADEVQAQAGVTSDTQNDAVPVETFPAPSIIYISDFYLDPASITNENRDGILQRRRSRSQNNEDPVEKAQKLVSILADSIMTELQTGGQKAERLPNPDGLREEYMPSGVDLPKEGWLVAGWFTKVDEGNRALSATIGFGTGAESVDIDVMVYDLSKNTREPFLHFYSGTRPKHAPGAIVTMNPYTLAVKFVLSKKATAKDVKKQGKNIAESIMKCIQGKPGKNENQ